MRRRTFRRLGALGLLCLILPGGALAAAAAKAGVAAAPMSRANGVRGADCTTYDSATVSLSDVDSAVLPLAHKVVSLYQHASPAERRHIKTSEMYGLSYQHVTEISVFIPVSFANGRGHGTYTVFADFNGAVTPQDMVAVQVSENEGTLKPLSMDDLPAGPYAFEIIRDRNLGSSVGPPSVMHWAISLYYGDRPDNYFIWSQLANGSEGTETNAMTAPILSGDLQQANYVMTQAGIRHPIRALSDLASTQKLVKMCR